MHCQSRAGSGTQAAPGRSAGAPGAAGAAGGALGPSSASSKSMDAMDAAESWLLNTQFAASIHKQGQG